MTKQQKLNNIEQLVNCASNKLGERTTEYASSRTNVLDSISKIFYKVGSAGKYISLVQSDNSPQNLLISFPGMPPKMAICPEKVTLLTRFLNNLLQTNALQDNKSEKAKCNKAKFELFREMYLTGNDLLIQLFINKFNSLTEEIETNADSPNKAILPLFTMLKDWRAFTAKTPSYQKEVLSSNDFITKIFAPHFRHFLTNQEIAAIKEIFPNGVNFSIFAHDKNIHNGMHVEAKGVAHYVSNKHNNMLHIGLATKFQGPSITFEEIGCCGACVSEFRVLAEDINITVYRTADFASNFPKGVYKPSLAIQDAPARLSLFITTLLQNSQNVEHANDELYDQYSKLLGQEESDLSN